MTAAQQQALRTARALLDLGHAREVVLQSTLIPKEVRGFVDEELKRDDNFLLTPARMLVADPGRADWLREMDRSGWYYWPSLRQFLISQKGWSTSAVRSLDDSSDKILRQLASPTTERFDIRGLVLGFVQSGKTANYTSVIAKAADAGYRLVIVLSGIDNGLRRQTNVRLKRELVGYPGDRPGTVRLPPMGIRWHEFTRDDLHGDFQPGHANHAALQGSQPVLLVVKKNGAVLRRLLAWLDGAPIEVKRTLPLLMIDDEADQASVDTRGTRQVEGESVPDDYEEPSVINGLIRSLLQRFDRRAYVAYTATPFANILIPHDTTDPRRGNDLYPKDFIIDLPKPFGYFGAEEIFGRMDSATGETHVGLGIIREVTDEDINALDNVDLPETLSTAIGDFVLGGAARAQRGQAEAPSTMLIHTSQRILDQSGLRTLVAKEFSEIRDQWRYHRNHGMRARLAQRWESTFRNVTRSSHLERDVAFDVIEPCIGAFLEAVQVKEINSDTGDVLDYEREPSLKAIAVGGNRLSRGLTLEGLMVSYFIRRSATYDTLMQMGRWFGFRGGYEDLTRIYTTSELESWFTELAFVEHQLREDIQIYETQGLSPMQVGARIWKHPVMQVTSPLKRRFASMTTIAQDYSLALEQTFKFPLRRLPDLALQAESNRFSVIELMRKLATPDPRLQSDKGPVWTGVDADVVLEFLRSFRLDGEARSISQPLICSYIERLRDAGELVRWTIAVRGLQRRDRQLGAVDWELPTGPVSQISRSRLGETDSLGVIVDPEDESIGLETTERGRNARMIRPNVEGLLLLYPISRFSGHDCSSGGSRRAIYDEPNGPMARDLVGIALSFPRTSQFERTDQFMEGTVGRSVVE